MQGITHDNSGKLVRNKISGNIGRTFNRERTFRMKTKVYYEKDKKFQFEENAILVLTDNLEVIGFID